MITLPSDALSSVRRRYWDRFLEIDSSKVNWPSHGAVQKKISYDAIESLVWPECRSSCLVFVDGYFDESLSNCSALPDSIVRLPIEQAMTTYGILLQNRLSKELHEEKDSFAALNGAMQGRGLFLYLPPSVNLLAPVQILSILSSDRLMAPRYQIFLGRNSRLDLIHTIHGSGMATDVLDVVMDSGSKLNIGDSTSLSADARLFRSFRATLKKDAALSSFSTSNGASTLRQSLNVYLCEPEASAILLGLDCLRDERQSNTHVLVEHMAPHCHSRQHFKKVLHDKSRSLFAGTIRVEQAAQKTEAYQLSQNLILSDTAAALAKPELEIFADDVKATHGATFSQLDPEEIFYCRSRGLSEIAAKDLLLQGFCRELIDIIPIRAMRERL